MERAAIGGFFAWIAAGVYFGWVLTVRWATGTWMWNLVQIRHAYTSGAASNGLLFWVLVVLGVAAAVATVLLLASWDKRQVSGGQTKAQAQARHHQVRYASVKDRLSKEKAAERSRQTLMATFPPVSGDPTENQRKAEEFAESIPDEQLVTRIAQLGKKNLYSQSEDSKAVLAPPREGKTNMVAVEQIRDAPGAVVTTSTKTDVLMTTGVGRMERGTVWVFDLDDVAGWPEQVRWNPVAGCEDIEVALRRGQAWAGAQPMTGVKGGDWFNSKAGAILGRLLHVAAVGGKSMRDVVEWSNNLQSEEPQMILRSHEDTAAPGVLEYLEAQTSSRAGETIDSIQQTLSGLLEPLAAPRLMQQLSPAVGEEFDIEEFLAGPNSLFLVCDEEIGLDTAPLVSMFANEVYATARRLSQQQAGGRLWPAVKFVLDEAPNLAAFPKMPTIVADSGGRGIEVWLFAQAQSQLVDRWGENGAATIMGSANVKYYLPGLDLETVKPVSELMGTFERERTSKTRQEDGRMSVNRSTEERPVMKPEEISLLPERTAILRYRNIRPMHVSLTPWWERADAEQIMAERTQAFDRCGKLRGGVTR